MDALVCGPERFRGPETSMMGWLSDAETMASGSESDEMDTAGTILAR